MTSGDDQQKEGDVPQLEEWIEAFFRLREEDASLTREAFAAQLGRRAESWLLRRLSLDPRWLASRPAAPSDSDAGPLAYAPLDPTTDSTPSTSRLGPSAEHDALTRADTYSSSSGASDTGPLPAGGLPRLADPATRLDPEMTHTIASKGGNESRDQLDDVSVLPKPRRFGNYRLLEVLGRGGMGVVFKAEQVALNRLVALKMIRSGELASAEDVARFYTEAKAAAKIEHPHVVNIYEVGEVDGHHFFTMDYLEGVDLSQILRNGPLPPRRAARIAFQMALAVMAAHERGFLHRDLKPANLVIDPEDHVTVTDFGLAKQLDDPGHGYTQTGAALGTPSYMSPEQAAGHVDELGPACDVYSMGAVLYAMLTATPPFRSDTLVKTIMSVIDEEPPPPKERNKDVDPDLATICMKCLQKDPAKRFANASEFADELQRYLANEPILSRPASPWRRAWAWSRRIPIVAALMGRRVTEPSPAHRFAQRSMIAVATLCVVCFLAYPWLSTALQNRMPRRVAVAGGQPDGAYHRLAIELTKFLESHSECKDAVALPTAGSEENAAALLTGRAQLALMQESALDDGGEKLKVVTPVYYEPVHIIVRSSAQVDDLRQLANRPVSVGLQGSGMNASAAMVLRALNLDVEPRLQHFTDLALDSTLDGALVTTGTANSAIRKLVTSGQFHLLPMPGLEEVIRHPAFKLYRIRPGHYPNAGLPPDGMLTVATPAFLVAAPNASRALVRRALEWVFDSDRNHPGFLSLEDAAEWSFMPLHAEATVFFGEHVKGNSRLTDEP